MRYAMAIRWAATGALLAALVALYWAFWFAFPIQAADIQNRFDFWRGDMSG